MTDRLEPITLITGKVIGDRIDGKWITMSNALTRACHGLTLAEKRIIMIAVAKLDSKKGLSTEDRGTLRTRIDAREYADQFGLELHTAHEQLRDAAKVLYERSITFYTEAHNRKGNFIDEPAQVSMRWIGSKVLYPEKGVASIQLSWNPELVPHLTGLRKQFTSYQLKQASALRSIYSWKLLELLMRFEKTGWAEYTVEDFCESMGASEKVRTNFGKVREKIINPAIKELTEKDNWVINLTTTKRGRRIQRLHFEFKRNDQLSLNI